MPFINSITPAKLTKTKSNQTNKNPNSPTRLPEFNQHHNRTTKLINPDKTTRTRKTVEAKLTPQLYPEPLPPSVNQSTNTPLQTFTPSSESSNSRDLIEEWRRGRNPRISKASNTAGHRRVQSAIEFWEEACACKASERNINIWRNGERKSDVERESERCKNACTTLQDSANSPHLPPTVYLFIFHFKF